MTITKRILVLGANGNFGQRICRRLNKELTNDVSLILASRSLNALEVLKRELKENNKKREIVTQTCDLNDLPKK